MYKKSFNLDDINGEKEINKYYGLPLAEIEIEGQKNVLSLGLIKHKNMMVNYFFQMDGGWSKYGDRYDKTVSNIHYVNDKSELEDLPYYTRDENALYYVGSEEKYYYYEDDKWNEETEMSKINSFTDIIDNNKGNNPHNGNYDDGEKI